MKIYWSRNEIPQLKGLTRQEQTRLIIAVPPKEIWKHWEVWGAFAAQTVFIFSFIIFGPVFPYKFWVMLGLIYITMKLAQIPHLHYLAKCLDEQESRPNSAPPGAP
jgi:hypothetical protein